ncbi:MAG: 8-oxo-dGTP diphosphatase [Pseudohongiellaceae bacterium]|jgi:8-oxo-dGTP diphosphatase
MAGKSIHVAVGVIVDTEQQILIALRPSHAHQGGLWEFPGGKVESGETVQQALIRELQEELGIIGSDLSPLTNICHDYGDKSVHLDVWWVRGFAGEPEGKEGQPIRWVNAQDLLAMEFPEANQAIITAIQHSLCG